MVIAQRFRRQAARCAVLAKQTHDDEGRERYRRLEQTYLQMAESEERAGNPAKTAVGGDLKPAA
jgi:hypothetical protein